MQTYLEAWIPVIALSVCALAEWSVRRKFATQGAKSILFGNICGLLALGNIVFLADPTDIYGLLEWSLSSYALFAFGYFVFSRRSAQPMVSGQGLEKQELDLLLAGSLGGVLLTVLISAFMVFHRGAIPKSGEEKIYLLAMVLLPPAVFFLSRLLQKQAGFQRILNWNLLYLNGAVVYWVLSRLLLATWGNWIDIGFMIMPLLYVAGYFASSKAKREFRGNPALLLTTLLGEMIVASALFVSRWPGAPGISVGEWGDLSLWRSPADLSRFVLALALTIGLAALIRWAYVRRRFTGKAAWGAALTLFLILLTFDPSLHFDYLHNNPYIGAGINLMRGGLPLVNVFCQYGLIPPYFYAALFKLQPDWSLHSVSVLNGLMNLIFNGLFFLLIWRTTRNRWVAVFGTVLAVWFHQLHIGINPSSQPMNIALRFFPDIFILLSLSYLPAGRRWSWHTGLALLFGGFFSLEGFIFCTGTLTAFQVAYGLLHREKWRRTLIWAASPLAIVALGHLVYSLFVHFKTGMWPQYQAYKEIVIGQEGSDWEVTFPPYFFGWALIFVPYLVALTQLWREREIPESGQGSSVYLYVIFPAAVMGVMESLYFIGRSVPLDLTVAMTAFSVMLIVSFDQLLQGSWNNNTLGRIGKRAALACAALLLFSCCAHLVQPMLQCLPNSTLLRRCLSAQGCAPARLFAEWHDELSQPTFLDPMEDGAGACHYYPLYGYGQYAKPVVRDAVALARKYVPNNPRLSVFLMFEDNAVLYYLKRQHSLDISSERNDGQSERLTVRYIEESKNLKEGEVIITRTNLLNVENIQRRILGALQSRFDFCLLEQTPAGVMAVRLTGKHQPCTAPVLAGNST